jgi:hypothetical protein
VSDLPNGTTARVHAEWAMGEVEDTVRASFEQIRQSTKLRPAVRAKLARDMAGAIGKLESLRIWLNAGAPQ